MNRGPAPSTVINAVRLIYASALLSILGFVPVLFDQESVRDGVRESQPKLSGAEFDTAVMITLGFIVALGIVFTIFWLVLAHFVRRGRNWARIVTWVLAGVSVMSILGIADQPPASVAIAIVGVVIAIAIIVLLSLQPSNEYFAARPS